MLVLTRGLKQKIYIDHEGERLEVTVTGINKFQVKLSFEAPKSFNIKRDNILKDKREVNGNR